ncbi:MAG TPA: 3-hydroxyacyl-CoA dehydrogenase NAD-binding domain-containing protein [Bacillales bacterium]|nr:3-hydroxyacyl-CoA dehydrogenase NAD-binding domain-containing protein [Bacillales bacterium]
MPSENPSIQRAAVVGTGVIGRGWIARLLAQGYDVTATDPAEGAETSLRQWIEKIWPTLERFGMASNASQGKLYFYKDLATAVATADFIQECVPEREDLKRKVLADIDQATKPQAIIASSTSGIKPGVLQADCNHPERVLVAHPFHPVYLLPLVELVGGQATGQRVIHHAADFYRTLGMKPLVVRQEVEGHIGDRLMEAIWREALHIVNDGVATTEEVDAAIVYGPGLRWALMGPFMTLHMAGGEQGMKHMLEQFGPALKLPWTYLQAPELTDELAQRVIEGCEEQTEGHTPNELEQRRDEFLIRLLDLVKEYWPAAHLNKEM